MNKLIFSISALSFLFLFGCSSSTVIKSNPPGAKLYLEGQYKGETPDTHGDMAVAGTMKTVTLKKEGYKDFTGHIKREQFSVGALIGGLFLTIPLIWILEYPPEYTFEMVRLESIPSDTSTKPLTTAPEKPTTLTPIPPSPVKAKIVTVTWTFANIRSGAGDNYSLVATVKQGDKLIVIGESGEWFNVRLENGQEGWIKNTVVK